MEKKMLKGYIPFSAPLNWEHVQPDDPAVRCVIGFTTNWYHERVGVDFSERYHLDPEYRFENVAKMKEHVLKCFPNVPYFHEHDQDGFFQECATVSNVYGVCLFSMLYGLKPVYYPHIWPAMRPQDHLSEEEIAALKPIDVENHPVIQQLLQQMDYIEKKWGKIDGCVNFQGVLNNAFKIRGADVFVDMIMDPDLCHHLLDHVTTTMIDLIHLIQKRQRDSGYNADFTVASSCVVNMISPENYEEFVMPYDRRLEKEGAAFGIHSCNWRLDPYAKAFSTLDRVGYVDFGFDSNLTHVRECFPETRRMVFYHPHFLKEKDWAGVEADVKRMLTETGPCDICLADIELGIEDEKIIRFDETVRNMAAKMNLI